MIIALLIIIVLLLVGVIALLVTGWTLTETNDIVRTGQDIRRELAQNRADTVQLLHSIRIELEESLREVIEQKFDAIEAMQSRGNSRRRRSSPAPRDLQAGSATATSNQDDVMEDENEYGPSGAAYIPQIENDRQFQLFPSGEPRENPLPSLEEQMRSLLDQPKQKVIREIQREEKPRRKEDDGYISMIRVLPDAELYDDIPDIENLPKLEEVDRSDAVPDPKAIRIKSERYIDDIPDIDEL